MDNLENKDVIRILEKKIAKTGPDYCIFLPRNFIKNGIIDPDKIYDVYLIPRT